MPAIVTTTVLLFLITRHLIVLTRPGELMQILRLPTSRRGAFLDYLRWCLLFRPFLVCWDLLLSDHPYTALERIALIVLEFLMTGTIVLLITPLEACWVPEFLAARVRKHTYGVLRACFWRIELSWLNDIY